MEHEDGRVAESKEKQTSTYVYEDHIERVFEAFTSFNVYNKIMKDLFIKEIVITNGKSYAEVGTSGIYFWKNGNFLKFEVLEVESTKNAKKVVFRVHNHEDPSFKVDYKLYKYFYWNAQEFKTLFVQDMIFDIPMEMSDMDMKLNEIYKMKVFKNMEKYLISHPENLFQEETIVIRRSVETVWDIFTNWNLFNKYVPSIGDKVVYDGNPLEVNSIMHVYHFSKNIEHHLKVAKVKIDKKNNREYILNFFAGTPRSPKQDLKFKFISAGENICIVSFKHIFKEYVKSKHMQYISKEKSNLLTLLKSKLESEHVNTFDQSSKKEVVRDININLNSINK